MSEFILNAVMRGKELQGKGASRRLRKQNLVPSIIYGGNGEPLAISLKFNEVVKVLESESFFSSIITIKVEGGAEEQGIIKALQRHPAKGFPMHADFQRIVRGEKLNMSVPVHFEGAEESPGIKAGGILSTMISDIDINCLPSKIPEYVSIDVSKLDIGDSLHMSEIELPEGVTFTELEAGTDRTVAIVQAPRAEQEESADESEDANETDADTASDDEETPADE